MTEIECWFCKRDMHVSEFDFARWSQREVILCEDCYKSYSNNESNVKRIIK